MYSPQFIPQQSYYGQPTQYSPVGPQPIQYVIQMPREEREESTCCAGWSGFFLTLVFSPVAALFTLCCFKSDRARGSMFIWSSFASLLLCAALLTMMFIFFNWAENPPYSGLYTGAGYYYEYYGYGIYSSCYSNTVYTYNGNRCSYQGGYTSYNYTSGTNVYKPNGYYYGDNQCNQYSEVYQYNGNNCTYFDKNPSYSKGGYYYRSLMAGGYGFAGSGIFYGLFFLIYVIIGFVCWCRKPIVDTKKVNPMMQPQIIYSSGMMPQQMIVPQQVQPMMMSQMSSANTQSPSVKTEINDANKIQRDEKGDRQQDAPAPVPLRKHKFLSLETLATDLGIDQLLNAQDVQEVLSMNYKELHAAYGVTATQYAKLKAYKENL